VKQPDWLPEGVLFFSTEPSVIEFSLSTLTEKLPKSPYQDHTHSNNDIYPTRHKLKPDQIDELISKGHMENVSKCK